jgi:hypothetical protein
MNAVSISRIDPWLVTTLLHIGPTSQFPPWRICTSTNWIWWHLLTNHSLLTHAQLVYFLNGVEGDLMGRHDFYYIIWSGYPHSSCTWIPHLSVREARNWRDRVFSRQHMLGFQVFALCPTMILGYPTPFARIHVLTDIHPRPQPFSD